MYNLGETSMLSSMFMVIKGAQPGRIVSKIGLVAVKNFEHFGLAKIKVYDKDMTTNIQKCKIT